MGSEQQIKFKEWENMKEYYLYLIILILISGLITILKPTIKGWFGETAVAVILSGLNPEEYQVINDVIIKTKRGTSQIDHVVVSNYSKLWTC